MYEPRRLSEKIERVRAMRDSYESKKYVPQRCQIVKCRDCDVARQAIPIILGVGVIRTVAVVPIV